VNTMIVGHRGARNLWPENSLTGFRNLLELPVEAVEFDVHLTDAGELVVIHDAALDRTTDASGAVRGLSPADRLAIRLSGSETDYVPTLDEVLELFVDTGHELHVELKADAEGQSYPGMAGSVASRIDAHGLAARSILTSFAVTELDTVRRVAPQLRTLLSLNHRSAEAFEPAAALKRAAAAADLIAIQMTYLEEHWALVTATLPLDRLGVWVPNSEEELSYWLGKGLRQLTTDRPDLAVKARNC